MGIGEIYALASAMVWAVAVIMFTKIGSKLPPFELNFIKNTIGMALLMLTSWWFEGFIWPELTNLDWAIVTVSGVIGIAIADTLYMKALNTIGAGSTGVVAALYSPSVVFMSMFYLGESLNLWQWIGMLAVLIGIVIISFDKPQKILTTDHPLIGVASAALSVLLTAVGVVMIKPILEEQPFFQVTGLRLFFGVLGMFTYVALYNRWQTSFAHIKKIDNWPLVGTASFLGAYLAMALWLAGYKYADASIAAILNETNFLFIVILAWLILREPISRMKLIGSSLTLAGVVAVVLT